MSALFAALDLHTSAMFSLDAAPMARDVDINSPSLYAAARGVFDYRRADPRDRTTSGATLNPYDAGSFEQHMWFVGWEMVRQRQDIPHAVQEMVTIMHRNARMVDINEPIDGPMRLIIEHDPDC